jgi:hypothetical protein
MIDIVERLRLLQKHQQDNDTGEAADTIEALRAENEKLREALKPFADAVLKDEYSWKYDINSDDFRAAAAAIRERGE